MGNKTRKIKVGSAFIGGDSPVLIQSMCSTKTTNIDATVALAHCLSEAGAGLVRLAVDSENDVQALAQIRSQTTVPLSVDLQENFRLAEKVAPHVDKIRYNPGHLHHLEPELSWQKKVEYLAKVATDYDLALRIGVNCGSIDPKMAATTDDPMFNSALEHAAFLDSIGFSRYCVSIKDSDPQRVIAANRRFSSIRPDIPLHLGVTEAGILPWGITKSQLALEPLLAEGIGDTIRVSLTVENDRKTEEVNAAKIILSHVANGIIIDPNSVCLPKFNIISCPSCSRVQNNAFVSLAHKVRDVTEFVRDVPLTIAVMGCRVNGPGETDRADIGLWCGPDSVHLKEGTVSRGVWKYDEIIEQLLILLHRKCNR